MGGRKHKKRKQAIENAREVFQDFEYDGEQFDKDLHGVTYYMQRSGPVRKPRFNLEDETEITSYEINTDLPAVRRMYYFIDQHDDHATAESHMFTFDMILDVVRSRKQQLIELGLIHEKGGGLSLHNGLINRLTQARRMFDGENFWLNKQDVDKSIADSAPELDA